MKARLTIHTLALALIFTIFACGGKEKEAKQDAESPENMTEAIEDLNNEMEEIKEEMEERQASGDTEVLHYEELAKFLPDSFKGYKKSDDMDGGTTTIPGSGAFSSVSQQYENSNGDYVNVAIIDYFATQMMLTAAMAAYNTGMTIDTPDMLMKGFKISDDVKGWQQLEKDEKISHTIVSVANRFYVAVEADNQGNTDLTNSVVEDEIDLKKLASMK